MIRGPPRAPTDGANRGDCAATVLTATVLTVTVNVPTVTVTVTDCNCDCDCDCFLTRGLPPAPPGGARCGAPRAAGDTWRSAPSPAPWDDSWRRLNPPAPRHPDRHLAPPTPAATALPPPWLPPAVRGERRARTCRYQGEDAREVYTLSPHAVGARCRYIPLLLAALARTAGMLPFGVQGFQLQLNTERSDVAYYVAAGVVVASLEVLLLLPFTSSYAVICQFVNLGVCLFRPEGGRGVTLDEPARPYPVVETRRHGRGAPGPSCSSWCLHRAHPPLGAGYSSS
eukprot:1187810-Prorocentrum_minimum.AAC.4